MKVRRLKSELSLSKEHAKRLENELKHRNTVQRQFSRSDVSPDTYNDYFSYKLAGIKRTELWNTAERIFTYSRRSLLAARIFRYAAVALAFIETSAILVIVSSSALLIIPILLCGILSLAFLDIFSDKKYDRIIISASENRRIVIIATAKSFCNSHFLMGVSNELAARGHTVIVVTSSLKDGLFTTARKKNSQVFLIREPYFFRLCKTLKREHKKIIFVSP